MKKILFLSLLLALSSGSVLSEPTLSEAIRTHALLKHKSLNDIQPSKYKDSTVPQKSIEMPNFNLDASILNESSKSDTISQKSIEMPNIDPAAPTVNEPLMNKCAPLYTEEPATLSSWLSTYQVAPKECKNGVLEQLLKSEDLIIQLSKDKTGAINTIVEDSSLENNEETDSILTQLYSKMLALSAKTFSEDAKKANVQYIFNTHINKINIIKSIKVANSSISPLYLIENDVIAVSSSLIAMLNINNKDITLTDSQMPLDGKALSLDISASGIIAQIEKGKIKVTHGSEITELSLFKTNASFVKISKDGNYLLGAGGEIAQIWDMNTKNIIHTINTNSTITAIAFDADYSYSSNNHIALATKESILLFDLDREDIKLIKKTEFKGTDETVKLLEYSKRGNLLLIGLENDILMFNISTNKTVKFEGSNITAISISQDEQLIAAGSQSGSITLWNTKSPILSLASTLTKNGALSSCVISDNNEFILAGYKNGTVSLFDLAWEDFDPDQKIPNVHKFLADTKTKMIIKREQIEALKRTTNPTDKDIFGVKTVKSTINITPETLLLTKK